LSSGLIDFFNVFECGYTGVTYDCVVRIFVFDGFGDDLSLFVLEFGEHDLAQGAFDRVDLGNADAVDDLFLTGHEVDYDPIDNAIPLPFLLLLKVLLFVLFGQLDFQVQNVALLEVFVVAREDFYEN